MKVKMFITPSEILEILLLITIISNSCCLHITKGSNLESSNSFSDKINNNGNTFVKGLTNNKYTKNEEISNMKYFKNFISNIIYPDKTIENIGIGNNSSNTNDDFDFNLKKYHIFKKRKSLNFNDESVKIALLENCTLDNCNIQNGRCISQNKCLCNYSLIHLEGVSKKACDYKLSDQLTAMMLEILIPIGFGHFYCKRYLIGFIKFAILFLIPLIIYAIQKTFLINDENKEKLKTYKNNKFLELFSMHNVMKRLISFYYLTIFFIWFLFDLVIFAANKHKDGSGIDLIPIYKY